VWRLKYLIYGMIPSAVLGILLYFLAPQIADALRDAVRDSAAKSVQTTFQREVPATVKPGRIVITENQLLTAVEDADARDRGWNLDGMKVDIADGRVSFVEDDGNRSTNDTTIASAVPQVVDGQIKLTDRRGVLSIFKPARDAIADEIEKQLGDLFDRSNVRPVSVTAENGQLVIVTQAIGGTTSTSNPSPTPTTGAQPTVPVMTPTPESTRSGGLIGNPLNRTPTPTP
jgi:hypothetical protein